MNHTEDASLFFLNMIAEMTTGDFSVTRKDGYFYISSGPYSYAAPHLTKEAVMKAAVAIQAARIAKEGW